ncbi:Peptidase family M28 [Mucilaginibacter gossypiicola]|uniref:Peptidase family M28 n=1 Tax=Mucilaginibacter gossypiicola TaxID=551995 RepID=A0A1H8GWI9_9SPHI|nr:M28 family peptidase [Mucilaginibacter gossypiicola]SEN48501.1 Peptidase family M28 [Mucilaginibacter gossypiicola]
MKFKLVLAFFFVSNTLLAQDTLFARKMVDTLTSSYFWGRGYTKDGAHKAAEFLSAQLKHYGVKPMNGKNYLQEFSYPVNTFPGKMKVTVNGLQLRPGKDFIVSPDSRGVTGTGQLVKKDSTHFIDQQNRIVLSLEDKLTWSAEGQVLDYTVIQVDKKALKETPLTLSVSIENKLIPDFKTGNVCGIVKGTSKPDSVIVITAHYDHLGGMGDKTYFPGANDNASGISELMGLARCYAKHPLPYSVAFICFSGEEAGLLGSKYFTQNPLIPLKNIRFLINLDLNGTGIDGITIVNASVYPKEFAAMQQINKENNYFVKVAARGKAANSDHYFFTEQGVPAFFIYTLGGIKAYHDVFDISATLPLNKYAQLFNLIVKFNGRLAGAW